MNAKYDRHFSCNPNRVQNQQVLRNIWYCWLAGTLRRYRWGRTCQNLTLGKDLFRAKESLCQAFHGASLNDGRSLGCGKNPGEMIPSGKGSSRTDTAVKNKKWCHTQDKNKCFEQCKTAQHVVIPYTDLKSVLAACQVDSWT